MYQLRRSSFDSALNTIKSNRKDSHMEASTDRKVTDKLTASAKSSKSTGATRQISIKEQLKPKIGTMATTRNNKRMWEENTSAQKSPPKKRVNCNTGNMPVETINESTEVRF